MGTLIIFFILGVFVIIALKNTIDHFMGIGGCCGDKQKINKKHLLHIVDHRQVTILGIHCQNCENRIKNVINQQPHLLCHHISHQKIAYIKSNQKINELELKKIIEAIGYQVVNIK